MKARTILSSAIILFFTHTAYADTCPAVDSIVEVHLPVSNVYYYTTKVAGWKSGSKVEAQAKLTEFHSVAFKVTTPNTPNLGGEISFCTYKNANGGIVSLKPEQRFPALLPTQWSPSTNGKIYSCKKGIDECVFMASTPLAPSVK